MGFSKQEYWSGLPFSFPEDLPKPGIEPGSPALQADSLTYELQGLISWILFGKKKEFASLKPTLRVRRWIPYSITDLPYE